VDYYVPNARGWAEIAQSPELRRALTEVGEKAKAYAESISPYDPTPDDEGHYRDSFRLEPGEVSFRGIPRAMIRLYNDAPYAAAVEWGYEGRAAEPRIDAHHVLGRTLAWVDGEARA
jgi:hypothetical protein